MNSMHPTRGIWFAVIGMMFLLASSVEAQLPQGTPAMATRPTVPLRHDAGNLPTRQPVANPLAPNWIPLSPNHAKYLDEILNFWQHKSSEIERYRCKFRRWEYDPVFGPQGTHRTYAEGVIKYSAPDKGLYRVDEVKQFHPPREAGGPPQYLASGDMEKEHWICDGKSVFEFDYNQKKLFERELPPDMRGKSIGKGPLPFLFNADAADIKRRFWIHVITPKDRTSEYWLEAVPKTQEDAANFKMVHVIIDQADFLPKAMVLFGPDYDPKTNPARSSFQFLQREVNFSILAQQLNLFHREFFKPKAPSGWQKIVQRWNEPVLPTGQAASRPESGGQGPAARR
jgi:TIGR03009 family protein